MRKHRLYYHVTDLKNVDQIKEQGLRANKEGLIFVFTDMVVSGLIAKEHYGLEDRYAVFKIFSKGITGRVIKDRVAEFSAPYQRVVIQEKISKRYIEFLGIFKVEPFEPTEWDFLLLKRLKGSTSKDARKVFKERRQFIKKPKERGD